MRILIRILAAVAALFVLGVVALALTLPRLVRSDETRARIAAAALESTGRELRYEDLDVGILPPRLMVTQARLAGETPEAEPMVEGADLQLRLALLPLLAGGVVVDSLVLEGATVRLVREKDGIALPEPAPGKNPPARDAPEATQTEAESQEEVALAVRMIRLADVRVVLEDRTVSPPVTWDVAELQAVVRGSSLDAPLDVDAAALLASGGSFSVQGRVSPNGPLDLELGLEGFDLAPTAPYLGGGRTLAGRVSGSVRARGETLQNPGLVLDLKLAEAEIRFDEISLQGAAALAADLEAVDPPNGSFALDATQAALRYGSAFEKPAGTTATVEGRVSPGEDGALVLEDTKLRVRNLDGRIRLETGARTRVDFDAAPFDLQGWEALLPALAAQPLKGKVGFDGLELVPEPLSVRGRIALDDLRVALPDGPEVALRGAFVGEGAALASRDLVAAVAGEEASLDVSVGPLARKPRVAVRAKLADADSNALLAALAGKPDTLSGPLDVDADLTLPLGGDGAVTDVLTGRVRFSIEPGRLKGVSLLRSAFERFGSVGEAAILLGRLKGGRTLQRFYDDGFEKLEGDLRLGRGIADARALRMVYRNYTVDLRGPIRLSDLGLDLRGELSMDEEIDAALSGEAAGGRPASIPEGGAARGRKLVLPLARVTGTLDDPKVRVTREAIVALATRTGSAGEQRRELEGRIDEYLGEGGGEKVIDVLEGFLGGRGNR